MTCIIVTGCYRSGSSAVAGVLHHLGVVMGEVFDPPSPANPKGYFEDVELKNFHKQFGSMTFPQTDYFHSIKRRERKYDLWGIKDPMLCHCLSMLVANLETEHRLIDCNRYPGDIVDSLYKQIPQDWEILVEHYLNAKATSLSDYDGPMLSVNFSEISEPEVLVRKISAFVDVPVNQNAIDCLVSK